MTRAACALACPVFALAARSFSDLDCSDTTSTP